MGSGEGTCRAKIGVVFESSVLVVSFVAAVAASIVGFGIGSLLTPLLALQFEMPLAVAIVSVPLRAVALSSFALAPAAFVATSTATGLLVDAARMPFYVWYRGADLLDAMPLVLIATAGVTAGTLAGETVLRRIPPATFRRVVSATVGVLGLWLLR